MAIRFDRHAEARMLGRWVTHDEVRATVEHGERLGDAPVETVQVSEDVNIDLAPDGSVYGVELLNANEQIGRTNGRAVVVTNSEETGEVQRLALDLPD